MKRSNFFFFIERFVVPSIASWYASTRGKRLVLIGIGHFPPPPSLQDYFLSLDFGKIPFCGIFMKKYLTCYLNWIIEKGTDIPPPPSSVNFHGLIPLIAISLLQFLWMDIPYDASIIYKPKLNNNEKILKRKKDRVCG